MGHWRAAQQKATPHVRFGSLATKTIGAIDRSISAVPPKAEMNSTFGETSLCANSDRTQCSRKSLLDHLVGACEQRRRHGDSERFGCDQVDGEIKFGWLLDRQVGRLRAAHCRRMASRL